MVNKTELRKALKSEMFMTDDEIANIVLSIEKIEALKTDAVMSTYSSDEESDVMCALRNIFNEIFFHNKVEVEDDTLEYAFKENFER